MAAFEAAILPEGEAAGKKFTQKDTADGCTAGIGESQRDKDSCQCIDSGDTGGLLQYLRKCRDHCFLHTQKKSPQAGAQCHKRDGKRKQTQGGGGAWLVQKKGSKGICPKKEQTADDQTEQKREQGRLLDDPPDIPALPTDMLLSSQTGNGGGEAGRGDAPCQRIKGQDELV